MEIRIPEVGESVHEALLAKWFRKNGDRICKDEPLCEIETDKITLDLNAEADGFLSVIVAEGETVKIGTIIGRIDSTGRQTGPDAAQEFDYSNAIPSSPSAREAIRNHDIDPASLKPARSDGKITFDDLLYRIQEQSKVTSPKRNMLDSIAKSFTPSAEDSLHSDFKQETGGTADAVASNRTPADSSSSEPTSSDEGLFTPADKIPLPPEPHPSAIRQESSLRIPMTPLRKRLSERLVAARNQTVMLTTFNEADISRIRLLRQKHSEHFQVRHGVSLGYMPFFVKSCVESLKEFPALNASIDGNDIVYHQTFNIGVAVSGEKGLVVPVLLNCERLHFFEIERSINSFVEKVKNNRLSISELEGGTFSITNGGVFGSMFSTPVLNPPQSAILGMHAIQDRPVVREGQIVVRPMMYLALTYDHRIVDGREAVGFLTKVKEYVEEPEELLLEG